MLRKPIFALFVCSLFLPTLAAEQPVRLLLTLEPKVSLSSDELQLQTTSALTKANAIQLHQFRHLRQLAVAIVPAGVDIDERIAYYQQLPGVKTVERDIKVHKTNTPNDPQFNDQWHLKAGFGINAEPAWDISTGSNQLVVAVIDTGIDYNHPELAANIWQNTGETAGDGIDNDGNGYVDDIIGLNAAEDTVDPMDEDGHGTQVSGIMSAHTDNNLGIAAINWQLQLLPCRFMDINGDGFVSDAVECLDYVLDLKVNHGVNIVATNNSWGSPTFSQALYDAISAHNDAGILFIASAGNSNTNARFYPAGYDLPNLISVTAHTEAGAKATFANYGRDWVDISAPGNSLLSTDLNSGISLVSGTSVAAPVVTGLVALLKAAEPALTMAHLRARVLASGAVANDPGLAQQTKTGRLVLASGTTQSGALTCVNSQLQRRIKPTSDVVYLVTNETLNIQLLSLNCDGSAATVSVSAGSPPQAISVRDDGLQGDSYAADGIYSGSWLFNGTATQLTFPDGTVQVYRRIDDYCVLNSVSEIPRLECEALVQLYYATQGQDWTEKDGWLQNATPCSWYGVSCTNGRVTALMLQENGLSGSLSTNFGQLTELTELDLSFNAIQGNFPETLLQLTKLQRLSLWSNAIEGSLPAEIGNLTALTELDLSFNRLSGTLPSQLGNLLQLQELYVEDNLFTGGIPSTVGQLSQLQILWLENNDFAGTLPTTLTSLAQLQAFGYANTGLCAPVTAQFGAWLGQIDTLSINTDCPNTAPQVSAGVNRTVDSGAAVQLGGTASDAEFNPLSYQWQQISGTSVTLAGVQALTASFTAPTVTAQSLLVFRLTANDGIAQSSADVTITVQPSGTGGGSGGGGGGGGSGGGSGGSFAGGWLLLLGLLGGVRLGKRR